MQAPYAAPFENVPPARRVTVEEYLAAEATALSRNEYLDGVVRAMPGAGENHLWVTTTLSDLIGPELRRKGACRLLDQDVRVLIPQFNAYVYPDRAIACPPQFASKVSGALENPKVIFEVLSPSTEAYDRGGKFRRYRSLQTMEEYVLISTMEPLVEVYARPNWALRSYEGLDAVAVLESVGLELPLRELYADLNWDIEEPSLVTG